MGDEVKAPLRLQFNPKIRLEFHGYTISLESIRLKSTAYELVYSYYLNRDS